MIYPLMKRAIDLSLILPCYNEAGLFEESVSRIQNVLDGSTFTYEIIFVDDYSSDGTQKRIEKTRHRAIFHARNYGRGRTVTDGMLAAKGKVVGYIDIDCEVDPVYMPNGLSVLALSNGSIFIAAAPALILSCLIIYHRKKILLVLSKVRNPGWFWDTEIMVYARRGGLRIVEEPVLFLRRFDKKSSVNIVRDTIDYIVQLVKLRNSLRK